MRWGRRKVALVAALAVTVVGLGVPAGAIGTTAALGTWASKVVPVPARDVAYDASRDVLLASVPGSHTALGNELVELDPETGAIGRRVAVGSEPAAIAITSDGSTAYIGLLGANRIARVDLATFTVASSFATTSDGFFGPRYPEDIETVPGRNDLVVASLMKPGFSPRHEGVWVFDDGVALGTHSQTHTGANRIEVADASTVYGYNNETTEFGFRRLTLTAGGISETSSGSSAIAGFGVDFELVGGRAYSTTGLVIDAATRTSLGSYSTSGFVEVTPANGRTTFLNGSTVSVYDTLTTAPIGSRSFTGIPTSTTGLVASGTGFAAPSPDGVVLLGPSVGGGPVDLPAPPASVIGEWGHRIVDVPAVDVISDGPRGFVYASVPSTASSRANHVVAIDSASGAIVGSVFVGSNPGPLAMTADRSRLYVGQSETGRIARIDLATFTLNPLGGFALGNASLGGALVAEDLEVRPGTLDTLAVSLRNTCCSPRHEGVAIYAAGNRLADATPGHTGANRIEFGSSTALYGTNNETTGFEFYEMAVGSTGVSRVSTTGYLLPGFGTEIDLADGKVFATSGRVVDPDAGELLGRFAGSGAVEADAALGRVFLANESQLVEFHLSKYTKVASRSVAFGSWPSALVRTPTGLAAATGSRVVLLTDTVDPPVTALSGVSPSSGPSGTGTWVTIEGTALSGATAVSFGGTPASSFSVIDDNRISALTPPRPAGAVTVSVTTPAGEASLGGGFTYQSSTTSPTSPPPPPPPAPGRIVVDRTSVADGTQRVHTYDPTPQVLRLSNGGGSPVRLEAIELHGDPAWYAETTCSRGMSLAPGQSCELALFFVPYTARSFSAELRIFGSSGSPVSVRLTGQGTLGYATATSTGSVRGFGDAPPQAAVGAPLSRPVVGASTTPNGGGLWLVASDGGIFSFGDAAFHGSTGAIRLNQPIVGMAATPSGQGYWLVASDGGIFSFGDAAFHGSTGAMRLNKPIVGMAATPSGQGYWLVASDGGIFSFGDAAFHGSTGAMRLNQPIVGMASTGSGDGYWFVASDGGIFSFGDAGFHGSTGHLQLNQPIVGMAASPTANGYWFTARDGGVFGFGDATFLGSSAPSREPVVAIVGTAPVIPIGDLATLSGGARADDELVARRAGTVTYTGD